MAPTILQKGCCFIYLLIGGYAVGYHGYPCAINDIDIWVENSEENANNLVKTVKAFGFTEPKLSSELFKIKKNIIRMGRTPMRIEIILDIDGVEFIKCYENKIIADIDGIRINIINLSDLKTNKKASGRHKDLADLDYLPK
jgi:hypothetical protein